MQNMQGTSDTISLWVDGFLLDRRVRGLAPGTLRFYRQKLALFQAYCIDQNVSMVSQISPTLIRQFLLWLSETDHNPGGVHGCFRALRAFLNWWEEETEPEKNPIKKVKAPKVPEVLLNPVSFDEVNRLIATCGSDFFGVRDKTIFTILLETGIRAGELASIDLSDLNLIIGTIQISHGKGGKIRVVLIGRTA